MKLHHTKYKKNYRNYILDCVETDRWENTLETDQDKIKFIFDAFESEADWSIERYGVHKALADWLAGGGLNIEYNNHKIIELAIEMGSVDENPTEKTKDIVISHYWGFMASIIMSMKKEIQQ